VLLDWMLPQLSGIEVCRRLRTRQETRNVPIVMLTAFGQRELIDRSGDLRIARAYALTPGHEGARPPLARPVDRVAEPGEEVIDGVRLSLQRVLDAIVSRAPRK